MTTKEKYFKKIIEDLTGFQTFDNEALHPLLTQMSEMNNLIEAFSLATVAEERDALKLEIRACQERGSPVMREFLISYGLSETEVRRYFENPSHFGPREWAMIDQMKQQLQEI
jgi:hypothetical protein